MSQNSHEVGVDEMAAISVWLRKMVSVLSRYDAAVNRSTSSTSTISTDFYRLEFGDLVIAIVLDDFSQSDEPFAVMVQVDDGGNTSIEEEFILKGGFA